MDIMRINWKVRIKNKNFWLAIIPAALVLLHAVASVFGFTLDLGDIGNKLIAVVEAAFIFLAILGVVNDPTTDGFSDSLRALGYDKPKKEEETKEI
jgi:phi LC3 family holin